MSGTKPSHRITRGKNPKLWEKDHPDANISSTNTPVNVFMDPPNPIPEEDNNTTDKTINPPVNDKVVEGTNPDPPNDEVPCRTDGINA